MQIIYMREIILGNRVPYEYFITYGSGQSNVGSEGLPYETGSYDAALTKAGIQNANIIEYTSVIPTGAKEISKEEAIKNAKLELEKYVFYFDRYMNHQKSQQLGVKLKSKIKELSEKINSK